jgi:hypothetical protein
MTRSENKKWGTRVAWGVLIFDALLVFTIGSIRVPNLLVGVVVVGWMLLSPLAASTWLVIHYRAFFKTWRGWAAPLLLLAFSSWGASSGLSNRYATLSFLFIMLTIVSGWTVAITTALFLWYRDVGLRLIGWSSVIVIWTMVFASRSYGNLIELVFSYSYLTPSSQPRPLWWLYLPPLFLFWILPWGIVSFVRHTILLIRREWGQNGRL